MEEEEGWVPVAMESRVLILKERKKVDVGGNKGERGGEGRGAGGEGELVRNEKEKGGRKKGGC